MEYNFNEVEKKWQTYWSENETYKVSENTNKEKYYVLDMFPYPSGVGLHVGHPLGYIASDIFARYKKSKGSSEKNRTNVSTLTKQIPYDGNRKNFLFVWMCFFEQNKRR